MGAGLPDSCKIIKSLESVFGEKVPGKEETFGDRIKAGKLPGEG